MDRVSSEAELLTRRHLAHLAARQLLQDIAVSTRSVIEYSFGGFVDNGFAVAFLAALDLLAHKQVITVNTGGGCAKSYRVTELTGGIRFTLVSPTTSSPDPHGGCCGPCRG